MSERVWLFTEGDRVHTMSREGVVRVWLVERDGSVHEIEATS